MSPVKTKAVVLQAFRYRESSSILHLFSESHGRIHGIAKGIRAQARSPQLVERGHIIETLAYVKPHRELHTLGAVQILEFFPSTRMSLVKSAVRDVAFELLLAAVTVTDPHPELFDFIVRVLDTIEGKPEETVYPWLLWRYYVRFAAMMGIAPKLDACICCGRRIEGEQGFLNAPKGGVECGRCSKSKAGQISVPNEVRLFLCGEGKIGEKIKTIPAPERIRMTRLLDSFCRYHFDIRSESKSLEFLEGLMKNGRESTTTGKARGLGFRP